MFKIEISYNGINLGDGDDAFFHAMKLAYVDLANEVVAPFNNEIIAEGGQVHIIVNGESPESLSVTIWIENISDDLKARLETRLIAP